LEFDISWISSNLFIFLVCFGHGLVSAFYCQLINVNLVCNYTSVKNIFKITH
jgi:hypothetical protein